MGRQHAFPWHQESLLATSRRRVPGLVPLEIELSTGDEEVELSVSSATGYGTALRIRVGHAPWARYDGRVVAWDMIAGSCGDDDFAELFEWPLQFVDPADVTVSLEDLPVSALLRAACANLTTAAAERADAEALSHVLKLPRAARVFVYAALLEDANGRIAQMLELCPALLSMAAMLNWADLVRRIRGGQRLRDLATTAVGSLGMQHRHAVALLRAAPARLDVSTLLEAARVAQADINDLPCSALRHEWFTALATWRIRSRDLDDSTCERMGAFVSRHAAELARHHGCASTAINEIVDWMRATHAAPPTRSSSVPRLLREVDAWHEQLWGGSAHLPDGSTVFPSAPVPVRTTHEVFLERIVTAGELYEEARSMRHCASSMAPLAARGHVAFFKGTCAGQRITVCVRRGYSWSLVEAAGFANAEVVRIDLVRKWTARLTDRPVYREQHSELATSEDRQIGAAVPHGVSTDRE